MKHALFLLSSLWFFGCHAPMPLADSCTQDSAEKIADKCVKKKGLNLSLYDKTILQKENEYVIEYHLLAKNVLGGGALVKVNKNTCRVTEKIFYQ